jgi:hypothetical protein
MNARTVLSIVLLSFGAGGLCGYVFRLHSTDSSLVLSAKDVLTDEYVTSPDTFSRVKNTRNALDSLSTQVALGITESLVAYDRLPRTSESEKKKAQQVLERAIHAGESAMKEFEGTEQQLTITRVFLSALREAAEFHRWIQVYTTAFYAHPTDGALCHLAGDAIKISQAAGQQRQVIEALRYALAFPAEFAGRAEIQAALTSASASTRAEACTQSSQTDPLNCPQL